MNDTITKSDTEHPTHEKFAIKTEEIVPGKGNIHGQKGDRFNETVHMNVSIPIIVQGKMYRMYHHIKKQGNIADNFEVQL